MCSSSGTFLRVKGVLSFYTGTSIDWCVLGILEPKIYIFIAFL